MDKFDMASALAQKYGTDPDEIMNLTGSEIFNAYGREITPNAPRVMSDEESDYYEKEYQIEQLAIKERAIIDEIKCTQDAILNAPNYMVAIEQREDLRNLNLELASVRAKIDELRNGVNRPR